MTRFFSLAVLAFALSVFAVPAGDSAAQADAAALIGHTYVLETVDGQRVAADQQPFIEFGADLAISGQVCNRYRGKATLDKGVLRAENIVSTRMLCPNGELSALETNFFRILEKGVPVILDGHFLIMRDGQYELMFHLAHDPLAEDAEVAERLIGRKFVLKKMGGEDFVVEKELRPYIQFGDDLQVSGSACNNFSGSALLSHGVLKVERAASTLMMCVNPMLSQFEGLFHQMLREGAGISVHDGVLTLRGHGLVLEYEEE